jgi:N,N-dimethylformamidase
VLEEWSIALAIQPTALPSGEAGLLAVLDAEGIPALQLALLGNGSVTAKMAGSQGVCEVSLDLRLPLHRWCVIGLTGDRAELRLSARIISEGPADHAGSDEVAISADLAPLHVAQMLLARSAIDGTSFDGKIDATRVLSRTATPEELAALVLDAEPEDGALIGAFDFAQGTGTPVFGSTSGHCWIGHTHNLPSRGVKGVRWDGSCQDWRLTPSHYGAAHFRSDNVYDMGWSSSFAWSIPEDLKSGAYAARITDPDGGRAYATVFVEPAGQCHDTVFLASTATYLAYANETVSLRLAAMLYGTEPAVPDELRPLIDHPEFGGSLYEHHADGSGVRTSSWLRPIVNLRPETRMWSFNADTAILSWLEREAPGYDLVTDHGLHSRGLAALDGARVVVTGTHPEYVSDEILDALEAFLARGGRLIYMGGNGFYWRTAFSEHYPAAIEIRRAEDGTRAWVETPGEYVQEFDGRLGGLWRRCGRPPNRLVGVGFAAQGFLTAAPYRRKAGATDPRAAFILEGVTGELIGSHGARGGGAASEEIDRWDPALGSPAHAIVLASSEGHGPDMLKVKEEFNATMPYLQDADVRADLTFFETRGGGAVFSTGSIGWAGALATNDYNNDVALITKNVLARFRDPATFEWPG